MAQTTKKTTKRTAAEQAELIGKFSPPYLRGMRDAFKALRPDLELQFDNIRTIADKLGLPFLAALLIIEGDSAPVDMDDVDQFNAWLETNELSREQALGEEA